MILYIENPKDSTRKLLELINEYSNVAGYKINIGILLNINSSLVSLVMRGKVTSYLAFPVTVCDNELEK